MKRLPTPWWPVLVGGLSLALTAWLFNHEQETQSRHLRDNFDFALRQTAVRIEQRMASYEQMLRGVRGLFDASDEVTRRGFATYVDALLGGADFAGLRRIAYAPLGAGVGAAAGAGATAAVVYAAPEGGRDADFFEGDLLADPQRRQAMLHARDSGGVAITRRFALDPAPGGAGEPGFMLFMPLYRAGQDSASIAGRRAHLTGWVLAVFRVSDLMSSLYGEGAPGLDVRIHDGAQVDASSRIYPAGVAALPKRRAAFEAHEYLGFAGHTWTVDVRSSPEFEAAYSNDSARIIAIAGTGLSAVLALLTWLLLTGRERAHESARAMTRQLRDSTERYRRIVETANEGIWTVDAEGRTTFVNPKLQQLLGYGIDEMIGRRWGEFMTRGTTDAATDGSAPGGAAEGSGGRDGDRQHSEVRLRRKDGADLWALLATSPIADASGRHAGVLAMVTDVTDRRLADSRREALEMQLRQSQKMEAIGTLAGGIAHDFNNVLAAILGNVGLLQQELAQAGNGDVGGGRLQQIAGAAARARGLVQQIVAFSRQQPHQLQVQPLQPLLDEAVTLLRSTMPAGVALALVQPAEPVWVDADATQLQQVLMNLCTNAWHALGGEPGRIEVGLAALELDADAAAQWGAALRPGAHALLWVSDNGRGMDEATRQRVFEPFFTTKPVGQGTGLGLSVVHGIVAAHGGAIRVDTRPGDGARFELVLPLAAAPAVPARTEAAAAPPRGHGERVLYVDDDPVMVVMVEGLLRQLGYDVAALDDPQQALARLRAAPGDFDLLVTDFNMPALSGLDLAREVERLRPGLPVVITSGYVSDALRADAQRAGVRHLLQKEYTLEQLGGVVHRVLAGRD